MVAILAILDGATEPVRDGPTSLERARTANLDRLTAQGVLRRVRAVRPGLPPGSETAIPALLGWTPPGPVDRGAIEAAAYEVRLAAGEHAWRVDAVERGGGRAGEGATAYAAEELRGRLPHHRVRRLSGHRMLVWGPPPLPLGALPPGVRAWPQGVVPPALLDRDTVVVAARGAAAGIARLMGARAVVPPGATGAGDTDLAAKARAAAEALAAGAARVVVHVAAPDEAAHALDAEGKVAAIERIDGELVPALAETAARLGATLAVCADHGCDPASGRHDAEPVPFLVWTPGRLGPARRFTERAAAALPETGPGAFAWEAAA